MASHQTVKIQRLIVFLKYSKTDMEIRHNLVPYHSKMSLPYQLVQWKKYSCKFIVNMMYLRLFKLRDINWRKEKKKKDLHCSRKLEELLQTLNQPLFSLPYRHATQGMILQFSFLGVSQKYSCALVVTVAYFTLLNSSSFNQEEKSEEVSNSKTWDSWYLIIRVAKMRHSEKWK